MLVNDPTNDPGNNTTQSEPSIAMRGAVIVVGYNDSGEFPGASSLTGYSFSNDGGASFTDAGVLDPVAGGLNLGDPSLAVDRTGRFFFATLAQDAAAGSFIGVARSTATTPAVTFGPPVLIPGLDPAGFQDKELIAVDTTGGANDGNVYVVWTEFPASQNPPTRILFSRSTDAGVTYSTPVRINTSGQGVSGAIPTVGPGGELYVAWQDRSFVNNSRIVVRRSLDGGVTWGPEAVAANFVRSQDAGASATCGRPALNGNIRVNEFPTIDVDRSAGASRGNVYVAYPGDPDGNASAGDRSNIFVTRSTDGGQTWGAPVDVTTGAGVTMNPDGTLNDNFFPTLTADHAGNVSVFYYDRRNDGGNLRIDLFRSVPSDQGATWRAERVTAANFGVPPLSPNFNPGLRACYMGDYNFSTSDSSNAFAVWGDNGRIVTTPGFAGGRPDPDVRFVRLPLVP